MLDSRLGKLFIIIFTSLAILVPAVVLVCGFESFGHYLVLPILPWAYLLVETFSFDFPWAVYPAFILLNICVVYTIGVLVEWLYHTYKERRS